jgi:WD40 repeat protein
MGSDTVGHEVEHESKAKVFISYSRKDMAFADRLDEALKARGFEPLIDRTDIYAFEEWWRRIEDLIARADTIVFVLSPDALKPSSVALKEVTFAASLNKRFAPVLFRSVEDKSVPEELGKLNFIFFDNAARFEKSADQLAEALNTDISWIRQHTEFGEAARRWATAKGSSGVLLRSPVLEQAERWIAARPSSAPTPTQETQAFIRQSRQAATRRRNILTGSLAAGLVLALGLAGLAYWQRGIAVAERGVAEEQRALAEGQRKLAVEQRDRALITQSRFLVSASNTRRGAGDVPRALALALEALPVNAAEPERPYLGDAELALRLAVRDAAAIRLHGLSTAALRQPANVAILDPTGRLLVTATGSVIQLLDRTTGAEIISFTDHPETIWALRFLPDGNHLIATSTKSLRLWNIKERVLAFEFVAPEGQQICGWNFSPASQLQQSFKIGTTGLDDPVNLFQMRSTTPNLGQHMIVASVKCSLTGAYMVPAAMEQILYFDARLDGSGGFQGVSISKSLQVSMMDNEGGMRGVVSDTEKFVTGSLSPNGRQAAIATSDGKVIMWDVRNFVRLVEFVPAGGKPILSMNFSGDGELLFIALKDGTLQVWARESIGELTALDPGEAVSGRVVACNDPKGPVGDSPDSTRRLLVEDGRVVLVQLAQGALTAETRVLGDRSGRVRDLRFSIDGSRALILSDMDNAPAAKKFASYDTSNGRLVQEHSYTAGESSRCAGVSPDEKSFFVLDERRLRLISTQTGEVGEIELPESTRFLSGAFNAVGNRLAVHLSDGGLAILETAHGSVVDQGAHRSSRWIIRSPSVLPEMTWW